MTRDTAISKAERARRAQGLIILGRAFYDLGGSSEAGLKEMIERVGDQIGDMDVPTNATGADDGAAAAAEPAQPEPAAVNGS